MRAYTEAIAIYKNNRDLAMKITSKYTGIKDPAILASTVDFYAPKLQRVPYPTVGGFALFWIKSPCATRARKISRRKRLWTRASLNNWKIAVLSKGCIRRDRGLVPIQCDL